MSYKRKDRVFEERIAKLVRVKMYLPPPLKQRFMTPMRWMYLAVISAFIAGFLIRGL